MQIKGIRLRFSSKKLTALKLEVKHCFYEMLSEFEKRLHYAAEHTELPEEPDMKKVQELVMAINEKVIMMCVLFMSKIVIFI